jgi:hypothetical protein
VTLSAATSPSGFSSGLSLPSTGSSWGTVFCGTPLWNVKYPGQLHFRTSMLAPIATKAWPVASIASRVTFMLFEKISAPGLDVAEEGSLGVED